jgi:hypothetical protein
MLKVFAVILCASIVPAPDAGAQQTWVTVCADAGAGGYEAFPDVCRLADGRLLAVFYAGYGHVSLPTEALPNGGRISYCISADEGQTWSAAQTLFDGPYDDRDPSVTQLRDGRLICTFFTLKPTGGTSWVGLGTFSVISANGGAMWATETQQISASHYCSSPVRELSDGRLILGLYGQTSTDAWGSVTISENGGGTWGEPIAIPNGGVRYEAETDVIERKDGSLFAALRGQNHSGWSVSSDGGLTWSTATLFGFPGHCHYLHRNPDDIILMAHRMPNTSLHYSLDECQTWSTNVVVDTVGGAYPSMVTLKDGSTLIVYYEEGTGSNIRAKRFRVTAASFAWLSPTPGGPVTRTWLNSAGGVWTNTADWAGGILPAAGEIADLSRATGVILLTEDVTVGEIHYNPAFSGTTNRLTILSDTGAPLGSAERAGVFRLAHDGL